MPPLAVVGKQADYSTDSSRRGWDTPEAEGGSLGTARRAPGPHPREVGEVRGAGPPPRGGVEGRWSASGGGRPFDCAQGRRHPSTSLRASAPAIRGRIAMRPYANDRDGGASENAPPLRLRSGQAGQAYRTTGGGRRHPSTSLRASARAIRGRIAMRPYANDRDGGASENAPPLRLRSGPAPHPGRWEKCAAPAPHPARGRRRRLKRTSPGGVQGRREGRGDGGTGGTRPRGAGGVLRVTAPPRGNGEEGGGWGVPVCRCRVAGGKLPSTVLRASSFDCAQGRPALRARVGGGRPIIRR